MSGKLRTLPLRSIFTVILFALLAINTAYAAEELPTKTNFFNGFSDIVEPLMPAVVNISTVQKKKSSQGRMLPNKEGSPFEELFPFFEKSFPPGMFDEDAFDNGRKLVSLGSGFIINKEGYIATNYHVIADAEEITVKLHNGTSMKAKLIGGDKETDIALLKIKSKKPLTFAKFGDSDSAKVGEWVIAVGNPFGLGNTVTVGVVSANGRDISSEGVVDNFIQTDAAINRGNSGGPMFNIRGEVIGINTQILSPSGVNIGIGFATPASIIEPVIKQIKTTGKVVSGHLGIVMQSLSEDLAESMEMPNNHGAAVLEVGKNTPAERAGILVGDIITSFNNKSVKSTKELQRIVRNSSIGKELSMVVFRNKKSKTLTVTLAESLKGENFLDKLGDTFKNFSKFSSYKEVLGATASKLDDDLRNKFGIESSINGIVLLQVDKKSPWYSQGFIAGDVLLLANGEALTSVDQLEQIISDSKERSKKSIYFLVQKKSLNRRQFMSLSLEG